jgi:hypothetical protein
MLEYYSSSFSRSHSDMHHFLLFLLFPSYYHVFLSCLFINHGSYFGVLMAYYWLWNINVGILFIIIFLLSFRYALLSFISLIFSCFLILFVY